MRNLEEWIEEFKKQFEQEDLTMSIYSADIRLALLSGKEIHVHKLEYKAKQQKDGVLNADSR